ncbi:glycoside hydrolase family 15 protein [Streptomyces sp. WMMB 322]|uniref:glycoside hydrolase family 15 protein n=1 Tax=Streptomyces sp. WMMB 322 TaxID=1286821 RepID=UPI000823CA68|nr:glycoside hydrolase family 15 protein [Streptomyces sp. WMMB 322]SCK57825.1 glucoamylase [Streptomyces sp. WMMB 322]
MRSNSRRNFLRAALVGASAIAAPVPLAGVARAGTGGAGAAADPSGEAPGRPGTSAAFVPADKTGFGTSRTKESPVWFTLQGGRMSETYYPDLSTPASRQTQLVITDGKTFAERLSDGETRTELCGNGGAPGYRLTSRGTGWRAVTRYVTDPERASVLIDVEVLSETGAPLQIFVLHDPSLSGEGNDDSAFPQGGALVAEDEHAASALVAQDGFAESTVGYLDVNDGWTQLSGNNGRLKHRYATAGPGNVVQLGRLRMDGRARTRQTVVLGFGEQAADAVRTAKRSLRRGFEAAEGAYERGWLAYLAGLPKAPGCLRSPSDRSLYTASVVTLAAGEDKRNPGAFIASPSMPWAFGTDRNIAPETGSYHLVWARDLYHIGTGLLAAGDRDAADRAMDHLLRTQMPDGHWSQNHKVDGTPFWTNIQLDETSAPLLLAWVLDRHDEKTLRHLRRGADFILEFKSEEGHRAPFTPQERWEEQSGYSPSTIASAIAALVCLADLMQRGGQAADAAKYLAAADKWRESLDGWTVSTNGPHSSEPYYLRLTKDGKPNAGTAYELGNNNEGRADQRSVVDAGFLELVRLGVKPADDPVIRNSLEVVDRELAVDTPSGRHWHRYSGDGYGEQPDGEPWTVDRPEVKTTYGRLWPIFSGERGEYELLRGDRQSAGRRLRDIAATAGETLMLPEQVWDDRPPVPEVQSGKGTASATPLAWTHAQYLRLAWSLERGTPVEYPTVVAERYLHR